MATTDQIAQAYRDILGREPDAEGLKYWVSTGEDINKIRSDIQIGENQQIAQLYRDILGRDPDAEGLKYWAQSGQDLGTIASNINLNKQQSAAPAYTPFDLNAFGNGQGSDQEMEYYNDAKLANWHMSRGDPNGYAQQFINSANELKAHLSQPYRVDTITSGGGDAGTNTETVLVTPSGNVPVVEDQNGQYVANIIGSGSGESGGSNTIGATVDPTAIAQQEEAAKEKPYGAGEGQALGYEYGIKNAYGDVYKKYDAQGNLTEFLDKDGKFQKASDVKPTGTRFNAQTGQLDTVYSYGGRSDIVGNSYVPGMSPYKEDQAGWLGEGGWSRVGGLVAAALTAGAYAGALAPLGIGGAGAAVPGSFAAVGTAAAKSALTSLAVSGLQGAKPADMLKAGLTGAVSGALGAYLPASGLSSYEQIAARVAGQTGLTAITGGDVKQALISSVLSSVIPAVINESMPDDVTNALNKMPESARKVLMSTLTSSLSGAIQGQDIPDAAIRGVTSGLTSVAKDFASGAFKDFTDSDFAQSFSNTFGSSIGEIEEPGGLIPYTPDNTPTNVADSTYTNADDLNNAFAELSKELEQTGGPSALEGSQTASATANDAGPVTTLPPTTVTAESEYERALRLYNEAMQELGNPTAESVDDPDFLAALERVTSPTATETGGTGTGSIYDNLEDPGGLYDVINPNTSAGTGTGGTGSEISDPDNYLSGLPSDPSYDDIQDIISGGTTNTTGLPGGLYTIGTPGATTPAEGLLSASGEPLRMDASVQDVFNSILENSKESGVDAYVKANGELVSNALYNSSLRGGATPEQAQAIINKFLQDPSNIESLRSDIRYYTNIDLTQPTPVVDAPVLPAPEVPIPEPVVPPLEEKTLEDILNEEFQPLPVEPEKEKDTSKDPGGAGTQPADEPTPDVTPTPTAPTPTAPELTPTDAPPAPSPTPTPTPDAPTPTAPPSTGNPELDKIIEDTTSSTTSPTPSPNVPSTTPDDSQAADAAAAIAALQAQIEANEATGIGRSEATDQAIKDVAEKLGTTEQAIRDAIGGVKTDLAGDIAGVKTDLSKDVEGVKTDLTKLIADNESAGLTRDEATNKAISDLAGTLGTTEQSLLDAIQGVATDLGGQITGVQSDLTGQMGDIEGRLAAQIAANEAAGMGRDEAFSSAVAGLGTQIGGLGTQIGGIGQGLSGLQQGLAGLSAGFGAYQAANAKAAATKQRQEQGQQLLNMLTSQGKGEVKSAPLASIDYMYDIGGESVFATPKQESLFLSPFENAPAPVEGAMPKYKYADGGFIEDDYTIDDLYRTLGS